MPLCKIFFFLVCFFHVCVMLKITSIFPLSWVTRRKNNDKNNILFFLGNGKNHTYNTNQANNWFHLPSFALINVTETNQPRGTINRLFFHTFFREKRSNLIPTIGHPLENRVESCQASRFFQSCSSNFGQVVLLLYGSHLDFLFAIFWIPFFRMHPIKYTVGLRHTCRKRAILFFSIYSIRLIAVKPFPSYPNHKTLSTHA